MIIGNQRTEIANEVTQATAITPISAYTKGGPENAPTNAM